MACVHSVWLLCAQCNLNSKFHILEVHVTSMKIYCRDGIVMLTATLQRLNF